MTDIAFLGLGAMGSRMARRLIDAGFALTVWNRSPEAMQAMVEAGARRASTPRDAAKGADIVISMVRDDGASEAVWLDAETGALAGLAEGAVAIESSTVTPDWVRRLAEGVAAARGSLLDAPVTGSRPQAEAGQLIFMVGGSSTVLETARPVLEAMGGAVHHTGHVGTGATVKLMVNTLFGTQLAVMAELIGLATRAGISAQNAVEIIGATPVCSPAAKVSASAMLSGQWAPAFPIDLVAKDFALVAETAMRDGAEMPVAKIVGEVFKRAAQEGYARDNITGIIQVYTRP